MNPGRPGGLFRGSELPRLLLLLAIMVVGWPLVFLYYASQQMNRPQPQPTQAAQVDVPPPDTSLEFQAVQDRTPLSFRENAAYAELLKRAREAPASDLARQAARGVMFSQLLERPSRYRGVPLHIEGTARRVLVHDELNTELTPTGKIYEAWAITSDSQSNPYCLVFEEPPRGLPAGDNLSERIRFNGYFFKLLAYQAADTRRAAPMLVGRLSWIPSREPQPGQQAQTTLYWLVGGMGLMTVYGLLRWFFHMRRTFGKRTQREEPRLFHPTESIEPQQLEQWLEQAPEPEQAYLPPPEDEDEES